METDEFKKLVNKNKEITKRIEDLDKEINEVLEELVKKEKSKKESGD